MTQEEIDLIILENEQLKLLINNYVDGFNLIAEAVETMQNPHSNCFSLEDQQCEACKAEEQLKSLLNIYKYAMTVTKN